MLALVRPESWNLPLFFHVLGATLTFGATATVALLSFAGLRGDPDRAGWLRGLAFWVGFAVLVPAFIMMRGAALWIVDKEYPGGHHEPGWVGVGFERLGDLPGNEAEHLLEIERGVDCGDRLREKTQVPRRGVHHTDCRRVRVLSR